MKKTISNRWANSYIKELIYSYIDSESCVEDKYKELLRDRNYDGDWSGDLEEDDIDFQGIWENEIFGLKLTKK